METEEFCQGGLEGAWQHLQKYEKRHQDSWHHAMSFIHNLIILHINLFLPLDSQGYLNQSTEMSFIIVASQWHLSK